MAFVIKKDKSYTWPVTISEPIDGGGFNDQKVKIKFKMLKQSRIDEVVKNEAEDDADILSDVLVGWDEEAFKDETGAAIPFNEENSEPDMTKNERDCYDEILKFIKLQFKALAEIPEDKIPQSEK